MRALALDFDGVISDSAVESFVVALRTMARQDPGPAWASSLTRLAGADAARVRADSLYRGFLELMPLGNRAEDFAVALRLLESGGTVNDQAGFDRYRDGMSADFLTEFHVSFYRERESLRASDPVAWFGLLTPFSEFVELLHRRSGDRTLTLATAKDRASVDLLLAAYGIEKLFPEELVIDKEAGRSKRVHLQLLRERLDVDFDQITFMDDKLNHLEEVSDLGVQCALAAWGYNGERERRVAGQRGFLVCDRGSAEVDLFGTASGG